MDKKYIELFKSLAQQTAASAETVMDYDRQKEDEAGLKTATIMRDDFQNLANSIDDDFVMTKNTATKLLVASYVITNQLQDRINALKTALAHYQTGIIPSLQNIVDNAKDDEEANKIANEKFIIKNEE